MNRPRPKLGNMDKKRENAKNACIKEIGFPINRCVENFGSESIRRG